MKEVLKLVVDEHGNFGWVFDPEVDQKVLPPAVLCAAVLDLQIKAMTALNGLRHLSQAPQIDLGLAADPVLDLLKRRNGS